MGRILFDDAALADAPEGTGSVGDLWLVWSNVTGDADIQLDGTDIAADQGLATSVLLSLFLDRRAEPDDVPPSGDPKDRRGWWADEFAAVEGDKIGSRLWLLDRSKLTNETALRAKEYAKEALQWMLDDKVAENIDITATVSGSQLLLAIAIPRPTGAPVTFKFTRVWDHASEDN